MAQQKCMPLETLARRLCQRRMHHACIVYIELSLSALKGPCIQSDMVQESVSPAEFCITEMIKDD